MRPGNNAIESTKASLGGDGLRIREALPSDIRLMVDVLSNSLPHIQADKIRPFAITAQVAESGAT